MKAAPTFFGINITSLVLFLGLVALFEPQLFAQDFYKSSIVSPTPFMGNHGEIFKLADGTVWEVENEYEYLYEYTPSVLISPSRGKLIIKNKSLSVRSLSSARPAPRPKNDTSEKRGWEVYEETNLVGSISGTVKKGRVFKTVSGNVYEVTGMTLQLVLELAPEVIVFKQGIVYKLVVEGFDEPLICAKLNSSSPSRTDSKEPSRKASPPSVIETQISGAFKGWEGETIVKLMNGQIWQQAEYYYQYHYAYSPNVMIYRSGGVFKMKVEGVEQAVSVRLIR